MALSGCRLCACALWPLRNVITIGALPFPSLLSLLSIRSSPPHMTAACKRLFGAKRGPVTRCKNAPLCHTRLLDKPLQLAPTHSPPCSTVRSYIGSPLFTHGEVGPSGYWLFPSALLSSNELHGSIYISAHTIFNFRHGLGIYFAIFSVLLLYSTSQWALRHSHKPPPPPCARAERKAKPS